MKNSEVQYQPLLTDEFKSVNGDEESGLPLTARSALPSSSKSPGQYPCSSKIIVFFVIAVFVSLYLFTTLDVSFVNNRRAWKPSQTYRAPELPAHSRDVQTSGQYEEVLQQRLLKPFSNLLNKLSSSVNKLSQSNDKNLSAILPVRIQLNESQTFRLVEQESSLAASYWERWNDAAFGTNGPLENVNYCPRVQMISPHQARMNNIYWQVAESKDPPITLYLYNAYYDNRLWGKPQVKIISVTDQQILVEKTKWWCLLWFDNLKSPVLSEVSDTYTVFPEYWDFGVQDGVWGPQIISCPIPHQYANQVPQAISIQSTGDCDQMNEFPDNVLRVIKNERKSPKTGKPSIGICVQAFRFKTYDFSVRLVEWLETVKLMGGEKVYFYVYGATAGMLKVLNHYQKEGFVNWRKLTLPGEQVNVDSLYNLYFQRLGGRFWPQELLELNDCLYRNLYRHDYVAIFDIDEMILPSKANDWHQLIENVWNGLSEKDRKEKAYYVNRHAYVYEMFEEMEMEPGKPIPDYMYMMRHTNRAELLADGVNIKCFHRTDLVSAVHNHYPMRCINTTGHHSCTGMTIPPEQSILMHYRRNRSPPEKCPFPNNMRKCSIHDTTAWRFFDQLVNKVKNQLVTIFE